MTGDNSATKLLGRKLDFGDAYAEVTAWDVPVSDRYPEGLKYSFQYGTNDGELWFRYDNFPDHPDVGHHHKHPVEGEPFDVEFEGLEALYDRFKEEVRSYGHDW